MSTAYTPVAKGLHWLMAVLILGLLALGIVMHEMPLSPLKLELYAWHKWFGITVLLLVWLRLAWRLTHRPPALPATLSPPLQRLAHAWHALLYGLMIVIPLSGWLMSSAKGVQTVWFGLVPLPDLLGRDRELGDLLQQAHKLLNLLLLLTLAGHVLAALWHHFVLKDDTLRRMR
jgi:cytochrome b561